MGFLPTFDDTTLLPEEAAILGALEKHINPKVATARGYDLASVIDCLDRAEALGKHSVALFPSGTYDVKNGLSLVGRTAQIRGQGASPTGTVFYASTQTGPVLDFTGWVSPPQFLHNVIHENFAVVGSNVADPTKNNAGVRLTSISSVTFRDISVKNTGGPAWEHATNAGNAVYLSNFERIILGMPAGAKANDVPWMTLDESNGCRFRGIGFRSLAASGDVGVSGALVVKSNASYPGHDLLFDGCWFEYLHVPTDGTLISLQGNSSVYRDWQFFDTSKEAGATGTSYIRFLPTPTRDYGGNMLLGMIPGKDTSAVAIDTGVDVRQSRNAIVGTKGYRGFNVTLAAGVQNTSVDLLGGNANTTDAGWIDNSGNTTNSLSDRYLGVTRGPAREFQQGAFRAVMDQPGNQIASGFRFFDPVTPANGALGLGQTGARILGVGELLFTNGTAFHVRRLDNAPGTVVLGSSATTNVSWRSGTGSPEGAVTAAIGSLYSRTDGSAGASLYVKETGTGNTGWVAK